MPYRISDAQKDLPKLNRALAELDTLRVKYDHLFKILSKHEDTLTELNSTRESTGVNNITFTWTGGTTTLSWSGGSIQDRKGNHIPIPAGSRTLAVSTYYWAAWNPIHQVMAFETDLSKVNLNPNNLIVARVYTGAGGDSGSAGGGGAEPGGWDTNRNRYKNF